MKTLVELAFDQVVALTEANTRYGKNALSQGDGHERVTAGTAFWRYNPSFTVAREERPGVLPSYNTSADSVPALEAAVGRARQAALDELPKRIQTWLRLNAATDRKLQPSDCFDGPKTFGHEFNCPPCQGRGRVECGTCHTRRLIECGGCGGKGQVNCSKCHARGDIKCGGCGGKGKMPSGAKCPTCNGRKRLVCPVCNGNKLVGCKKCGTTGKVNCPTCGATGWLTCENCRGTGRRHTLRVLACEVGDEFSVVLKDEKPEVTGHLRSLDLVSLRTLAAVGQTAPVVDGNVVRREYEFECRITEIKLKAADRALELIGYGPRAQIFDFKSVVTVLLEADLKTLKQAVANTPFRPWGSYPALLEATKLSLASKANVERNPANLIKLKLVTPAFVREVQDALGEASERLLFARTGLALLVTVLLPAASLAASIFGGLRAEIGELVFAGPVVVGAAAWALLEHDARRRLMEPFNATAATRMEVILKARYALWKLRGLAFAASVILLGLAAFLSLY
jgi:hypothetical protein